MEVSLWTCVCLFENESVRKYMLSNHICSSKLPATKYVLCSKLHASLYSLHYVQCGTLRASFYSLQTHRMKMQSRVHMAGVHITSHITMSINQKTAAEIKKEAHKQQNTCTRACMLA